ncbi:uncharacterized protein LTR77_007379 [Saxophila tyrrhenica]|uniref:Uncharacterized protein n=1 Tax=Saxophila tyrrhenica TaxID=1690608 RepID=A0AAV9P8L4_9PEZI|nr:hypothetical protein LTR77_007379 [Saxophila tyrrhenica]
MLFSHNRASGRTANFTSDDDRRPLLTPSSRPSRVTGNPYLRGLHQHPGPRQRSTGPRQRPTAPRERWIGPRERVIRMYAERAAELKRTHGTHRDGRQHQQSLHLRSSRATPARGNAYAGPPPSYVQPTARRSLSINTNGSRQPTPPLRYSRRPDRNSTRLRVSSSDAGDASEQRHLDHRPHAPQPNGNSTRNVGHVITDEHNIYAYIGSNGEQNNSTIPRQYDGPPRRTRSSNGDSTTAAPSNNQDPSPEDEDEPPPAYSGAVAPKRSSRGCLGHRLKRAAVVFAKAGLITAVGRSYRAERRDSDRR